MICCGLVGEGIAHSWSPKLFEAAFSDAGLKGTYRLVDVPAVALKETLEGLREERWVGFNVTLPHKQAVMPWLEYLEPGAQAIGAVNCVRRLPDGRWVGENTDGPALVASVRGAMGFDLAGARALVLGAGGVARAATYSLDGAGMRVEVSARRGARAAQLPGCAAVRPWGSDWGGVDLLVNCTPLGMAGYGDDFDEMPWSELPSGAWVMDCVYTPRETSLLQTASARGHGAIDGVDMLVRQAEAAFFGFTGTPAPPGSMADAAGALDVDRRF